MGETRGGTAAGPRAVVMVLVLLAFVVVLAGLTRPVVGAVPRVPLPTPQVSQLQPTESGSATPLPSEHLRRQPTPRNSFWARLGLVVEVLLGLAMAAAVAMMALRLRPLPREDTERPPPTVATPAPPPDLVAAADEGLALLSTATDVGDAVIVCWVWLEQAAAATGRPRHPAATPTEFTADLLVAGVGEEIAVRELLGLYQAARFGSHPLPTGAAARAIACLAAIRASAQARTAAR